MGVVGGPVAGGVGSRVKHENDGRGGMGSQRSGRRGRGSRVKHENDGRGARE